MVFVVSDNLKNAYSEALRRLLSESKKYEDPELFREDVGIITIQNRLDYEIPITLKEGILIDPFPYSQYFPHVTDALIEQEMRYWNQQFLAENKLPELIKYLRSYPLSKRGIILFWEDKFRDLSKGAVCEIAAFFRLKHGLLEMHSHMRANNAAFLLFMDMRILMGVQRIVAKELGVGIGDYFHFIDSLHIYENEKDLAIKQSELAASALWKNI
jgi:hypothetical protein